MYAKIRNFANNALKKHNDNHLTSLKIGNLTESKYCSLQPYTFFKKKIKDQKCELSNSESKCVEIQDGP